jgi:hypothetical protein
VIGRATSQLVNSLARNASGDWPTWATAPIWRPLGSKTPYSLRSSTSLSFCRTTSTGSASSDAAPRLVGSYWVTWVLLGERLPVGRGRQSGARNPEPAAPVKG